MHHAPARCWHAAIAALALVAAGCAPVHPPHGALAIDRSITARSQSSRIQFVVVHYTSSNLSRALALLSEGNVSSHYLITDETPPRILQLVDEDRSAWHAGDSAWRDRTWLNATSIGIEIVHPGYTEASDGAKVWQPYPASQIDALTALLRDIVRRHGIRAHDIVGHSDIAPQRKLDPGPLFPWKQLALQGLGRWFDEDAALARSAIFREQGLPDMHWFQQQLKRLGYQVPETGELDGDTRTTLAAFQMHYRPSDFRGIPDAETAGILAVMQ